MVQRWSVSYYNETKCNICHTVGLITFIHHIKQNDYFLKFGILNPRHLQSGLQECVSKKRF
jgi:hypothetical protein